MKWKTVGQIAKWTAIAVVPGAAGYVAYRYVIHPWLENRAAKKKTQLPSPGVDDAGLEETVQKSSDSSSGN